MARLIRPIVAGAGAVVIALTSVASPAALAVTSRLIGPIDLPPVGSADAYTTAYHTTLFVAAPGVLANDIDLDSDGLIARLTSGPANGDLDLEADGGFRYQPDSQFSGVDTFTYRPFDGISEALLPATVTIIVAAPTATPTATPKSTPMPKPTPTPTPTGSLPSLPIPTLPIPSLPVATPGPIPATPTPSSATASPDPRSHPTDGPAPSSSPSREPAAGGVAIGAGGPPAAGGPNLPPDLPSLGEPGDPPLPFGSFGDVTLGFEWMVPTVLVAVPGFLLIVVGLAQLFGGVIWLPLARRWLRGDGRPDRAGRVRLPE